MKSIPLVLFVFTSLMSSLAFPCISLPRTVALENSPYFFKSFKIHGYFFEFQMSEGQQNVRFSCEKNEAGVHQWFVEADDDLSTTAPDSFPKTHMPETTSGADGQLSLNMVTDSSEVPVVTSIGPFVSKTDAATVNFNHPTSPIKMSLRCLENSKDSLGVGSKVMVVEFKDQSGNIIASVGAQQATGVRGITPSAADAVIDMANLSPSHLNIPGCGGNDRQPSRSGSGQKVKQ